MSQLLAILPLDTCTYRGEPWLVRYHVLFSIVITFRSLVHVLLEDGEAASIGGVDLGEQVLKAHSAKFFPARSIGD